MNRSYKKHPCSSAHTNKYLKKLANKRVRYKLKNPEEELQNGSYKKNTCSWDIYEYKFLYTWKQFWEFSLELWNTYNKERGIPFPDEEKEKARWRKWYKGK